MSMVYQSWDFKVQSSFFFLSEFFPFLYFEYRKLLLILVRLGLMYKYTFVGGLRRRAYKRSGLYPGGLITAIEKVFLNKL